MSVHISAIVAAVRVHISVVHISAIVAAVRVHISVLSALDYRYRRFPPRMGVATLSGC
jgi:hypothetical protein